MGKDATDSKGIGIRMSKGRFFGLAGLLFLLPPAIALCQEQFGGIRGLISDSDFETPLPATKVFIAETGQTTVSTDEGNFVFPNIEPGIYTLVFSKEGYTRQVKANVTVSSGQMAEVNISLAGEFEEMEEFVVQDLLIGVGTEAALLELRLESPALMDSISSELMSQAGASDAASALNLISGTTVQDGKYAVVRGLPDRYVNSQMNSVRLPTADAEKRAVQLDQFPTAVIDSIQISKTFTPDQQGDASGGAVNVILKGIPAETALNLSGQYGFNTNVMSAGSKFLSYKGGGVDRWGRDDDSRDIQPIGTDWGGAVGVWPTDRPMDYKWSVSGGGKRQFEDFTLGGFGSFFYERDSSHYSGGSENKFWVDVPGDPMTPQYSQGAPSGDDARFFTSLFDVTQSSQSVRWGGMGMLGLETENHSLSLLYMYTRDATDQVTLMENTRGKASLHKYWPGSYPEEFDNYDPTDPAHPGNSTEARFASPYQRNETLEYTERTTQTLQISGQHTLPDLEVEIEGLLSLLNPELDWTVAASSSTLYQPDKRQFATYWYPRFTGSQVPGVHRMWRSADTFNLGNLQRVWKDIQEDSDQYFVNLKLPFEQWSGDEGYFKFGIFHDRVDRKYNQDSFSNVGVEAFYIGDWKDYWSRVFPDQEHLISESEYDVDYEGKQKISAWYYMADLPLNSFFNIIGGVRYEDTSLSIVNFPESKVEWYPTETGPVKLNPGDADVDLKQKDMLPSIGFQFKPWESITFRGTYSETIARQTFKELTPIKQQEYLGGDYFIGNPSLRMSALDNYDLRLDYTPYKGGLFSISYFKKDVTDPIEYVQKAGNGFTFTKPVNYPKGKIEGFELEVRQDIGRFSDRMSGLSLGANATFINSEVILPLDEAQQLRDVQAPEPKRDMTNAPEYLYNLFALYEIPESGTQLGLFYTVRGDTLVAGAGVDNGRYIPSIYETEYGTLNFSLSQKLGEIWTLKFQAKNLLDPDIETVYRSKYIGSDVTKTSYQKGMEFSVSLSARF